MPSMLFTALFLADFKLPLGLGLALSAAALLRQGALVRRTLRAFPYAKLYNKPLLERLRQRQQMLKADFQAKQQHMREELAQREQALREELKKRKPQKQG